MIHVHVLIIHMYRNNKQDIIARFGTRNKIR